ETGLSVTIDASAVDMSTPGSYNVTYDVTDTAGNPATQVIRTVTVQDTTGPTIPNLPVITGQCSATVPVPTTTDSCTGLITGTTSDPLTYNSQGSFAITWNFDDGNGNSINVVQNVVIDDTIDPVAVCQDITIPLDNITGTATITGAQIDNGSTDNCGTVNFNLSQSMFDCSNIGTNVIVLTVDDGNGNTDTCTATVTVTSPTITGGTLVGYLNNNQTPADADDLVEVTACPDEPQNATFTLSGHTGNVAYWESSNDGGVTWTTIANTTTTYTYTNILETTLIRAVVQIGSCQANSSIVVVAVIPPDLPPTIIGPDTFTSCLGDAVTVQVESSFAVNPEFNNGGQFDQANLPGWLVDGLDGVSGWSASGSNSVPTAWRGISNGNANNSSNITEGVRYKNQGFGKFAITYGNFGTPAITTLETAVFNTLGLSTASLDFQSAYYLQAGAVGMVELSVDGGTTYPVTLMSFSGPGDSGGFVNLGNGGNNVPTINLADPSNGVSLDLTDYIGLTNLRIRFTFTSTVGSSWAIDGITLPQAPVDEVIEWTDDNGIVVTTGSTTTITPVTPGVQIYGATSLINGCRADGDEGTEFVTINSSLAYAGEDISQIIGECGEDISLNAYDNNLTAAQNILNGVNNASIFTTGTYPGTSEAGVWSANQISACGGNYTFSDLGSPTSKFTADPGTYELTWTIPSINCSDTILVTIESCPTIDFDGNNDYITFKDNYDFSSGFSLELWVKPESVTGTQTLISKRDANNRNNGYDLSLVGSTVQFNFNSTGSITSSYPISTDRWYHIAVTYDNAGNNYRLYIDGIEVSTPVNAIYPVGNSMSCIVGAMDQSNNPPNKPVSYFNGWIDELRIWDVALTDAQIRMMMNQEIENNTAIRGAVVPLDVPGLNWADLDGYYRMDVNCGKLLANKGIEGLMRNMNSVQQETAPIPYTSRVDGQEWATDNTWTNFSVWDAPNSNGVDGVTPIEWNIVQASHNIESGDKDITVLGLISDVANKELTIMDPFTTNDESNDGQMLRVTHYLDLDGDIDLVGESQLLQDENSILDNGSAGKIERDQQGTTNIYNYNYWSSPATTQGSNNNSPYTINSILRDGTNTNAVTLPNINWIGGYDASPVPLSIPSYWLFSYENFPLDSYSDWNPIGQTGNLNAGLGFTMKGSGAATPYQNYVFVGKPNNGTISNTVSIGNQVLVGNPYPSAIDANEFIRDNIPVGGNPGSSGSIDGTLYFWEHYTSNITHILEDYEGGYATYTLTGGNPAVSPPLISGLGTSVLLPEQFIPVSQGYFVTASSTGGLITFNNDQRVFVKETSGDSQFFRSPNSQTTQPNEQDTQIKRLRFDYEGADGYHRYLLLGFIDNEFATDGFDYGYDAEITDLLPNDLSFVIEGKNCSTQGVGAFDDTKQYPLSLFSNMTGEVNLSLTDIENFEASPSVYIYDSFLNIYTLLNENDFQLMLEDGEYLDRFYIVFNNSALSLDDELNTEFSILYLLEDNELFISSRNISNLEKVELFNINGQKVISFKDSDFIYNGSELNIRIKTPNISEGVYIVKCHISDYFYNKKVVIKR
ncbi:LamG-like jellyroll fold domain-containing protein, partial [uncultured Winogradskyella sp.]|uniref:LamG-like jellyroll fold domain-containing protein n=1 Tax=uncultured Winogradskyella sp. TaxID=395353 RepID=UPI002611C352